MIEDYCISKGMANIPVLERSAIIKISAHDWPGNYRELKSCIENAVICCEGRKIRDSDLNITNGDRLPEDEKGQLIFFLTKHEGKKVLVMKDMGITAPTLDKKLKLHCIDYKLFKPVKKKKSRKTTPK